MQRLVDLSAHPEVMQEDGQLSRGRNDGSLLPTLSAALGQLQSPTPEIAVDTEWPQDVLCSLHQPRAQIRITFLVILGPAARETL